MAFHLCEFSNTQECNLALVAHISTIIREQIVPKKHFFLAVSGGKSPIALFNLLSKTNLAWECIFISLVDERIVSLKSEHSNTHLVQNHLLQNLAQNANFIPILKDHSSSIKALLEFANANYKQADLAILGMGTDGHTASLFADASEIEYALNTDENIVLLTPKNAPYQRLSMSLKALEQSKRLILILQGEEKRRMFERACIDIDANLPVSYILHSKKVDCDVYYSK